MLITKITSILQVMGGILKSIAWRKIEWRDEKWMNTEEKSDLFPKF